jgi:hypothetical protein
MTAAIASRQKTSSRLPLRAAAFAQLRRTLEQRPLPLKAEVAENLAHLRFTDEITEHAHIPAWACICEQIDGAVKRWEQEAAPLLWAESALGGRRVS